MSASQPVNYDKLVTGFELPVATLTMDRATVSKYTEAVEEPVGPYQDTGLVPPMAVAACALGALAGSIAFPPGGIHASQEFEFVGAVSVGDTLTTSARITQRQNRGKLQIMAMEFAVLDNGQKAVLSAKSTFILPA